MRRPCRRSILEWSFRSVWLSSPWIWMLAKERHEEEWGCLPGTTMLRGRTGGVQKSCRVIALTEPQTPDPARQWGGRAGRALWVPENPGGPGPGLWPHTGPKQPPADTATAADRGQALGDPSATGWASRTGLRRNVPAGSKRQARARGQPLGPY